MVTGKKIWASVLALAIVVSGVSHADEPSNPGTMLAGDSSPAGLLQHQVDVINNSAAVLGDTTSITDTSRVEEIKREQENYFQTLLKAATGYSEDAMNAASQKYGLQPEQKQAVPGKTTGDKGVRYRLYISSAMGDGALKQAMEFGAKYNQSMVLSLRGPLPGEKLDPLVYRLINLIGGVSEGMSVPNIEVNPPSFTDNQITTTPTLVVLNEEGVVVAKAAGVMNPEWIESEIKAGHTGDLGVHGRTTKIAEIDLMLAMIEKAKAQDPKALAEKARRDMWKGIPLIPLPAVTERRDRELDAGFYVTEDIPLPDGTYLARKGDYFNPLDAPEMVFNQVIVIVDATKKDQVDFAAAINAAYRDTGVITMLSDIDRETAWDVLAQLTHRFKNQPFLLTNDVQERFRVEKVPTVITVVDKKIVVQELPTSMMERAQ